MTLRDQSTGPTTGKELPPVSQHCKVFSMDQLLERLYWLRGHNRDEEADALIAALMVVVTITSSLTKKT